MRGNYTPAFCGCACRRSWQSEPGFGQLKVRDRGNVESSAAFPSPDPRRHRQLVAAARKHHHHRSLFRGIWDTLHHVRRATRFSVLELSFRIRIFVRLPFVVVDCVPRGSVGLLIDSDSGCLSVSNCAEDKK